MHERNTFAPNLRMQVVVAALVLCAGGIGCRREAPPTAEPQPARERQAVRPARIVAQGQLLPAGGLIRLNGTPGDTVEDVLVSIGDSVQAGQPLIRMRSAEYRQSQLDTLRQQLDDAQLQHSAAIDRAKIELSAARMALEQAKEQVQSAKRREQSLALLKRQWEEAEAALKRAEALAQDPLTRALVSRLDVDKQRASVTAAQLQYEQQREAITQAQEAAQGAEKLATEKVSGAEKSLELAERIDPTNVIRAQIKGAEQQLAAAKIVSPISGTVVSIDAHIGESVSQLPLMQVADLSRMVCQVEIYQTDAPLVRVGQEAEMSSDALDAPLHGRVVRVDRLIGSPQLRSTDPLAKVDYRTLPVLIEVASEDVPTAAKWLQLQVEVRISLGAVGRVENETPSQSAPAPNAAPPQAAPSDAAKPNAAKPESGAANASSPAAGS
ncbi:MAG: efflux RND transporter periplasmic adaptor subunit [Aureliella sp.]